MKTEVNRKKKILLFLSGLISALILMELFLRFNPKFGYRYSFYKYKCEKLSSSDLNYLRPSALLGYEYIPNYDKRINSYGLMSKKYNILKQNGILRILILGDSIAGYGWSAEFLEELLNGDSFLNSKYKFEVWNSGVPSYDVRRYALYLKYKGLRYKPDILIIFLFMNDCNLNISVYYKTKSKIIEYYFPITEVSKFYVPSPFFLRHSYLYRFIILTLDNYLLNHKKTNYMNPHEEDGEYYLGIIKDICDKNKIPLLVVIYPYLKPLNKYENWQLSEYQTICKVVKDLRLNHLNLYEYLSEKKINLINLRDVKEDDIHPSREGHKIAAELIYNYLKFNILIKK